LLQHFRSYLENNSTGTQKDGANAIMSPVKPIPAGTASASIVYVKKWMRTKHAIMFRLSNKIV
jgi:polo-like kinase 1